jgi:hypothetical protein
MLTIAGGIILAGVIVVVGFFLLGMIRDGITSIVDPYGRGRTRDEWRRDCASTARHARDAKRTRREREDLERWFRSVHGVSMDDL